jgi:aldehyde:ferredoxin oxidoreductase
VTPDEINEIGTRIVTMARLYLLREGFTVEDDTLPERAYQPLSTGPIAGKAMTPHMLREAMQRYFVRIGWDERGVPINDSLKKLGLSDMLVLSADRSKLGAGDE